MKITETILSIPPFLSTTWKNIATLHVERGVLIVGLQNQSQVEIPYLSGEEIEAIFEAHAKYNEPPEKAPFSLALPFQPGSPFTPLMEHNPNQANLPPLPPEALDKIAKIGKIFGIEETALPSPPEPDCHCIYCQVARAFHGEEKQIEEEVKEEDLQFRSWEVKEISPKLYQVTHPLDPNETYQVFLGEPLGCTCGEKNCEHLRAVLKS